MSKTNVYEQVQERYTQGAQQRQEALCCPVDYDQSLLKALPREIIDKDYGCGDPSRYVRKVITSLIWAAAVAKSVIWPPNWSVSRVVLPGSI